MTFPTRISLYGETYIAEDAAQATPTTPAATTPPTAPVTAADKPMTEEEKKEEKKRLREVEEGLNYFLDDEGATLESAARSLYKKYCDEISRQYRRDKAEVAQGRARLQARLVKHFKPEDDEDRVALTPKELKALQSELAVMKKRELNFPSVFEWLKERGIPPFMQWSALPPAERDRLLIPKGTAAIGVKPTEPSHITPTTEPTKTPTEPQPAGDWWNPNLKFSGWGMKIFTGSKSAPPLVMYIHGRSATEIMEVYKYHHPKHIVKEDDLSVQMQYETIKGRYSEDRVVVEHFAGPWKRKGKNAGKPFRVSARFMGELIYMKSFAKQSEAEHAVSKAVKDLQKRREKKGKKVPPFAVKVSKVTVSFDGDRIVKILNALAEGKRYRIRIGGDTFLVQRNKKPTVKSVPAERKTDAVWIKQFKAWIRLVSSEV